MATAIQRRRGTTTQHGSFTGLAGEITIDTTKNTVVVHDGSTAGGIPLAKSSEVAALGGADITAVVAGNGLSGGSTSGDATINLDLNELSAAAVAVDADSIPIIDASDNSSKKESIADLVSGMAGTNLTASSGTLGMADTVIRGKISVTDAGGDGSLAYNNSTGVITYTGPSAAEVRAHISGGTGVTVSSGEISIGQAVATTSDVTFADVIISGNLTVSGTQTTVNTETLTVDDNIIVLNNNESGTPSQDAGIEVERGTSTNVKLQYDEGTDKWQFTNDGSTYNDILTVTQVEALLSVTDAGGDGSLAYNNTTGVFTYTGPSAAEVRAHISGSTGIDISAGAISIDATVATLTGSQTLTNKTLTSPVLNTGVSGTAIVDEDNMASDSASKIPTQQSVKAYVDAQTTDETAEGSTNLYYTNARVDAYINASILTTDISEGTNLYYTDARADARIEARLLDEDAMGSNSDTRAPTQQSVKAYVDSQVASKDNTDEITEGSTNLYFTNARADARITNALKDEDNMASDSATHVPSQQSVKAYVDSQVASKDALSELSGNTDDVSEGSTNLYYTDARAQAVSINNVVEDTTPQLGGNLDVNGHNINYGDNEKATFGDGPDLEIYHDSLNSYIADVGTGSIVYKSGTQTFQNAAGSKTAMTLNTGGAVVMAFNNNTKIETTNAGAKITGDLNVTGSFDTVTTDGLTEGSSNLYYTDSRVDARITKSAIDALNVDADTIDGIDSASLLRSDAADTHTGTIMPATDNSIDLGGASNRYNEVYAVTFQGTATSAQYADLAEKYVSDKDYDVGTVMIFGGSAEVTQSTKQNCPSIAGVVSTDPAFLMNEGLEGGIVLALRGRVPVKVTGAVRKGDVLICSNTPGHAEAAPFKGYHVTGPSMIGIAISEHLSSGTGVVEAQIK